MDEKIMEMLVQVLQGQTEMKNDMVEIKSDMAEMMSDMVAMKCHMARMESNLTDKIDALFDFQESQMKINQQVLERLDRLDVKVDDLQLETAHVRRVK